MNLETPFAILIGSAIIALAIAYAPNQAPRFQIASMGPALVVRLDQVTGEIGLCQPVGVDPSERVSGLPQVVQMAVVCNTDLGRSKR